MTSTRRLVLGATTAIEGQNIVVERRFANALGVAVPRALLARADEVIQ